MRSWSLSKAVDLSNGFAANLMLAFPTIITLASICMGFHLAGASRRDRPAHPVAAPGIPLASWGRPFIRSCGCRRRHSVTGVLMVLGSPTKQLTTPVFYLKCIPGRARRLGSSIEYVNRCWAAYEAAITPTGARQVFGLLPRSPAG